MHADYVNTNKKYVDVKKHMFRIFAMKKVWQYEKRTESNETICSRCFLTSPV